MCGLGSYTVPVAGLPVGAAFTPVFVLEGGTVLGVNFGNEPFTLPPPAHFLSVRRYVELSPIFVAVFCMRSRWHHVVFRVSLCHPFPWPSFLQEHMTTSVRSASRLWHGCMVPTNPFAGLAVEGDHGRVLR